MTVKSAVTEVSAGGVVTRGFRVLLIRMRNLKGELVWTFPKGHLEEAETPRQAALREVEEEAGYRCEILAPLATIRYSFERSGRRVMKRVRWYWMRPRQRVGQSTPDEVFGMKWFSFDAAKKLLRYPGDFRLLEAARRLAQSRQGGEIEK